MRRGIARLIAGAGVATAAACGPIAHIPPLPVTYPNTLLPTDGDAILARALAPVLYLQPDEWFPLERVVAVVHPTRPIIAYHLLWQDDVHGAWLPFTIPTDEEIVWVGYDSTGAPTDVWTYWHGRILHTPWHGRQVAIDVQWGKHGSLPHNTILGDLPRLQRFGLYYAFTFALPDYFLGWLNRPGPLCFCHGYARYREFTVPILLAPRLSAVVRTAQPQAALHAVFGAKYSGKRAWP